MSDTSTGHAPPGDATATAAGQAGAARTARRSRLLVTAGLVAALVAAAAASSVYLAGRGGHRSAPRVSGLPANVSTSLAYTMGLSSLPAANAPGFTLTDQAGRTLPLSSFHGKAIVLEFMDPHCKDICPIVSEEFLRAYRDLGPLASKVVFATVNVNQYYTSISDVAAFSREQQLTTIPSWHFFTGAVPALRAVWRDYHIDVQAPNPNADIVHTSAVYFIDPQGHERYIAAPMVDHNKSGVAFLPPSQLDAWGHGIALVARDLAR